MSDQRYADVAARILAMQPAERVLFIERYAKSLGVSVDEAADHLTRIESGETFDDIARLESEIVALGDEIARMKAVIGSMHVPSDRPWMWALEMQFAAMRLLSRFESMEIEKLSRGFCLNQLAMFKRAEAYSWSADTSSAVWLAARTVPTGSALTLDALPGHAGWWWFDQPLPIETTTDKTTTCAVLWATQERGVEFSVYALDPKYGAPLLSLGWTWPHDMTWAEMNGEQRAQKFVLWQPDDIDPDRGYEVIAQIGRFFLAGCAWLRQRVVTCGSGHVERHRRKQLAREIQGAEVASSIHVIQLRRSESAGTHTAGADAPVEWSCRWIVSGHWRNQPYANGERKLIYIMPFVKGPSDRPLKVPTHTVYQVSR